MKRALLCPPIPVALAVCLLAARLPREVEWKVPQIFQALAVREGQTIADIGCGDGFLTTRLAAAVGPQGKVLAVDIDQSALNRLRSRLEDAGMKNVEITRSTASDPMLAPESLDGAVVLRAYHEFSHYREMLAKIRTALRPGARLVIADVGPDREEGASRESQCSRHVLAHGIAAQEMAEAGFRLVLSEPRFARLGNGETVWLLAGEHAAPQPGKT